jgi:hypothetical protein
VGCFGKLEWQSEATPVILQPGVAPTLPPGQRDQAVPL